MGWIKGTEVERRVVEGREAEGWEVEGKGETVFSGTANLALARLTLMGVMTGDTGDTSTEIVGTSSGELTLGEACLCKKAGIAPAGDVSLDL